MKPHSHEFVNTYDGFLGYGLSRETDENTVICYLQKFSDDTLIQHVIKKMSDEDLSTIFEMISRLLKTHLSEPEYHRLFLKEDHP
jgi:hypothetical protein